MNYLKDMQAWRSKALLRANRIKELEKDIAYLEDTNKQLKLMVYGPD